jgi:hypothetical protein
MASPGSVTVYRSWRWVLSNTPVAQSRPSPQCVPNGALQLNLTVVEHAPTPEP